jgi:hypothetical protein
MDDLVKTLVEERDGPGAKARILARDRASRIAGGERRKERIRKLWISRRKLSDRVSQLAQRGKHDEIFLAAWDALVANAHLLQQLGEVVR